MLQDRIDSELTFIWVSIAQLLIALFIINHIVASVWYLVGRTLKDQREINWIDTIDGPDALEDRYTLALHWSLCMFTPGSMAIQPEHSLERSFAIVTLFFGLVIFSSFISSITAAVNQLKTRRSDHSKEMWLLRRYLRQRGVEHRLTFRILRHVEYVLSKDGKSVMGANKVWALTLLSTQLRSELTYVVSFPCLSVHPLLLHMSQVSSLPMLQELVRTALSQISLAATDVLFEIGTQCAHMHIIVGGTLVYVSSSDVREGDSEIRLRTNDWLCEPVMWTEWLHRGTATSQCESELVSIEALAFIKALKGYAVQSVVRQYAEHYIERLGLIARKNLIDARTLATEELTELVQLVVDRSAVGTPQSGRRLSGLKRSSIQSAGKNTSLSTASSKN